MLTEQERMNNAFKEMLFAEEQMAKKYSGLAQQITDPETQQMLKGMEQDTRNHYGSLTEKMKSLKIQ
jgi:rubrerythrin